MKAVPPICVCPTIFGIPFVGITVTYWQPMYVSEVENRPGCLSSLGGISVLGSLYNMEASEQTTTGDSNNSAGQNSSNRMQVHWYTYPVFEMLDLLKSVSCKSSSGFNLAYMTEFDPLWQNDVWSAVFAPEANLFANPMAQFACAVDAVASQAGVTTDPLFWCAGNWGPSYPLAGNSSHVGVPFQMNNEILAKFISRSHRLGLMEMTIGPAAICSSMPAPVWIKSQYRYDQIGPVVRRGRAVVTGDAGLLQFPPIANYPPTGNNTDSLIWQGQQCCLKPIP
jgi:conjugal transfer pilus assembly protein TraU